MSKKMVQINPKYMSISKNNKLQKKKKQTTIKNTKMSNPNAMRKKLLNKIKNFQKKTEEQNIDDIPDTDEDNNTNTDNNFSNEFNKSLLFLQNLSNSKKKHTKKNKKKMINSSPETISSSPIEKDTIKSLDGETRENNADTNVPEIKINTEIPPGIMEKTELILPRSNTTLKNNEPKYGCLKNGTKPTYKEWKRKTQSQNPNIIPDENLNEREKSLHEIKLKFKQSVNDQTNTNTETKNNKPRYQHQIKTTKYKLGKDKTKKAISILIKNSDTRKKINSECDKLRKKSIVDVKNYLRKRNLLKAGSDAPPDVLRSMYENAVLTGEIKNESKETMLHNFYNN